MAEGQITSWCYCENRFDIMYSQKGFQIPHKSVYHTLRTSILRYLLVLRICDPSLRPDFLDDFM